MDLQDVLATARDAVTVRRVFAEPYEKDGVTVIAAAAIGGGAGGGSGTEGGGEGEGAGFGVGARPVGAFVISGGTVTWRPAVDLGRLAAAAAVVLSVLILSRARTTRLLAGSTPRPGGRRNRHARRPMGW